MTAREVAEFLRVDPQTVHRWGRRGLLMVVRTPGGAPRFRRAEVMAIARGQTPNRGEAGRG